MRGNAVLLSTVSTVRCLALLSLSMLVAACGGGGSASSSSPPPAATPVSLAVSPATASVHVGGGLKFDASVSNAPSSAVTWSVEEPSGGTVDASGNYHAPATPGAYHVLATSVANNSAKGVATVQVMPVITVAVSPQSVNLVAGASTTFAAAVSGGAVQSVTWSIQETSDCGQITSTGAYTAPTPSIGTTCHVTATSVEDPSQSAVAAITVSPVALSLSPQAATVPVGQSYSFSALVSDAVDTSVVWSVASGGAGGTITQSGVYTAPASAGVDHIQVSSHANPSVSQIATVTITAAVISPTVTVAISPLSTSVATGGTVAFSATVSGTPNHAVTWSLADVNAGSVSASGVYTAPSIPGLYQIVATSQADPAKSAVATVTVTSPVAVSITPTAATLSTNAVANFTATVTGSTNQGVTWTVREAGGGMITPSGQYTAPATAGTYHVVATSKADPTKSVSAPVTVSAPTPVSISLSPASANLGPNAILSLAATVTGSSNQGVSWSIQEGAAGGTVTSSGVYTAPNTSGTFHVVATSEADTTKTAVATITVTVPVSVTVSPSAASLATGASTVFTAAVTGTSNQAVTWSVLEGASGGTVNNGDYRAPGTAGTFHVVATSQADPTKSATATVTVAAPIVVSVTPASVSLVAGASTTLTASVSGTTNQAVVWSVEEGSSGGTVSAGGSYTAPGTAGTYHVVATSAADASKSARATITVTAAPVVSVSISPTTASLLAGDSTTFAASVSGSSNHTVNWTVRETGGGSVTTGGVYTAPASAGTYHVVATSAADSSKSATATVNVTVPAPVTIAISPTSASVLTGASYTFAATVSGTSNVGVTWSVVESGGGTVTAGGVYTAPGTNGVYHVVATSQADTTKTATASVTVNSAATTSKTSWVWIGNTGLYPWGCSAGAGCSGDEVATAAGSSYFADIQAHPTSFSHVSITLYTLNQCDGACTCPGNGCQNTTHGIAYASGRPFLVSCNTQNSTNMCTADGPDIYDADQATRASLVATYHGMGLKVSALVYAGSDNYGTDKGAAAVMCGGSTSSGQSVIDSTLATVCSAQRNFINAMVAEARQYGYDDINLDWELGDGSNGSDANLGAAPTFPKVNGSYAQAFSNFITNFKSALRTAGLSTTLSVDAISANVNGTYCSGGGGYIDAQVLTGANGALTNGSLDYVIVEDYNNNLVTTGAGAAAGYPPQSCGTAPNWANNFYGPDKLDSSNLASCDDSMVGYALMMCAPNWGSTVAIDASRVVIALDAGANSSNDIAGKAMQTIVNFGFRNVAIWPDYDGSAANASFMSTQGINVSGFALGGSDWYQMLSNWKAAP